MADKPSVEVKQTLGLTGATMNAMALIAPGAFLWTTYQLQAAATLPDGTTSAASDIWAGLAFALGLCFLTAFSYSELARIYPEAGFGSAYYFAEKAFLDRESKGHHKWARLAKIVTGWAAHLFYWVYPGVMLAFGATLVGYIYQQFTGDTFSNTTLTIIGCLFGLGCGYIAYRGIVGSTLTAIVINAIQLICLVGFSILAIVYRLHNPEGATQWAFSGGVDVMMPHSFQGVMVQATIAILVLVGFESCTALAAETKDPHKNIPRAVILSLVVQGLFAYMFEYFAASYMVSEKLTGTMTAADGTTSAVTGMAAAAASSAPIGDMAIQVGNAVLGGIGFGLMITIAITVAIAIFGTTLSCLNTAVRVSYAMAQDEEMPEFLGVLHGRYATPHRALWILIAVSCVIGAIGVQSVVGLTGITLASNLGTFMLYGLTCIWTIVAFVERHDRHLVRHLTIPVLGLIANIMMVSAILYLAIIGSADSLHEAEICFAIAGAWALVTILYVAVSSRRKGQSVIGAPAKRTV
jgi:basic amino acid/polyamine antiporter, APA family